MDGRYLGSGFTERRATSGETADWAYSNPASSSYGASHIETELPQRQSYVSSHTLTTYTTSHHPTGVSGVFDASLHTTGGSTTESSVMNFLSSIESRGLQAGPAVTSLLPQFRTSPWQTGTNTSTELFLTGALPSSGTFSTLSALSSYQHPSTFPTRSFPTTSALTVQHTTFSPSNGLLSPNDPLLQIKSSQTTVPTAFAFDRLGGASLGASLPIQSSTYRSAQESAPHLLQPQFSLLPSPVSNSQQTIQPYGAPVFSSSIERALQRECSVIKHHQRPSSTQPVQQQMSVSAQHSLQDYLPDDTDVSYQDPSRHTPVPNSPSGIPGQAINSTSQQKTATVQLQQTQTHSSSVPSSGFSSTCGVKAKDDSCETAEHLGEGSELHEQVVSSPMQQHGYPSTAQKQSSVIASQSQPYSSAQLSSLMSISPSQTYITSQSLMSNLSEPQAFSSNQPEKLPSIYKTLPSLAPQSENETSVSCSLMYASDQKHIISSASNREDYSVQTQRHCMGNASHNYSSSHSQSLSTVSYYPQGPESVSPSQSYASGQSVTPSPPFSSSFAHSLPSSNSTRDYTLMQSSPSRTDDMLLQQTQKYLLSDQSTASTATYTQAIQNNQSAVEQNSAYGKSKEDESMFLSSKENCGELPIRNIQALQQSSISSSTQTVTNSDVAVQSNVVYVVSKMEDRHAHSVIRSNSRSEDQLMGLAPMSSIKDERMSTLIGQLASTTDSHVSSETKNNSHVTLSADQLKEHSVLLKVPTAQQEDQSNRGDQRQLSQEQAQFVQLPSAQVLLEPSQMILLQHPLLHTGPNQSKPVQTHPVSVQFLQMNNEILNSAVSAVETSQIAPQARESTKQHLVQKDAFSNSTNQHDAKQHFTLSSICFPDSMLMADERNILSNVDDILAATAAACGVTPQDFKSSSSEGDLGSISSPSDSKCHYELANNKHEANTFPSQHMISNTQTITFSVNGGQLTTDIHKEVNGNQEFSHIQQNGTKHELPDKVSNHHKKNEVFPKGLNSNASSMNSNGGTINTFASNHTNYNLTSQEYNPTGFEKADPISKNKNQSKVVKSVKLEGKSAECSADGLSKKRVRSKGSSKQASETENGQQKSQKRSGQVKRQNSKGSETSPSSASEGYLDGYQQQERIRQKIREVEEKQPEVKTGFIGSFLDFLKSGPKQQFSSPPIRSPNRTKKPSVPKRPFNQLSLPPKPIPPSIPVVSPDISTVSSTKRLDEDLQKNLETLPTSSDEDESVGKNQDLQKSISSALSSLDESTDKQSSDSKSSIDGTGHDQSSSAQSADKKKLKEQQKPAQNDIPVEELVKNIPPNKLAVCLNTVAIEGLTDEELSDSGEEGMYRERDEFVVKNEDIESLQVTLKAGIEPPAIWKVQKALLQKFIPELRDGKRVFSATNSYLGYFGDAKTMYRRVYIKFLDTVNKREYVRVCNRKPRCKPMHSMRGSQKALLARKAAAPTASESSASKSGTKQSLSKPRPKQSKAKAEPPPKKRKKWKEEFTDSTQLASPETACEDDEFTPPVPFASRFLNTRMMKETFKSFVELLISVALDADVMATLEKENDELLLPHMKRVDGMITDNRRRLLPKLRVGQVFKNALDNFPELSVVTELKTDGETPTFKVRLSGKAYNRKTMKPAKSSNKLPLEYTVEQQKTHWFSLYHSLQHYKYHTYLMCMEEIALLRSRGVDLGQEETVQTCMGNRAWVEGLFDRFGELLTQMAGKPFRATFIWSSIINNLQTQVEVKRRRHNLKSYHDCFLGSEAVDVVLAHIIQSKFCSDDEVPRFKAVRLCQALMDSRVFEAVDTKVFGKEKRPAKFEDSSCSLYRFLNTNANKNTIEHAYESASINRNELPKREEEQEYSNTSPVKTDKSLEEVLGNLNSNTAITPQLMNLGLSQELVDEVWHQQATLRLLQLIELPLLESLLEGKESPRPPLHGMDSDPDLLYTSNYVDREILKAFSEAHADAWLSAAVDCLEFLPDQLVVEVSRGLAKCPEETPQYKRLLYSILIQHYGQTDYPPLFTNHVFDIHSGISELLVNGKQEQALEALQLCLKLQDSRSREELRRLLRFMALAAQPSDLKLHKE
ncbi:glutamine and serine-rich protein 1, partial [Clarias magur]